MAQNALRRVKRLVGDDLRHNGGEGDVELVRLVPAKRIRQIALCVRVYEQHLLALPRKPDTEVDGCGRFAHAAFLVGEGDYFGHDIILLIEMKKAACYCKRLGSIDTMVSFRMFLRLQHGSRTSNR